MCKTATETAEGLRIPETPIERERRERNEAICREFKELTPKVVAQGYKPYRAITMIAGKYGMTHAGIIFVLQKAGLYTNAKECAESLQSDEQAEAEA